MAPSTSLAPLSLLLLLPLRSSEGFQGLASSLTALLFTQVRGREILRSSSGMFQRPPIWGTEPVNPQTLGELDEGDLPRRVRLTRCSATQGPRQTRDRRRRGASARSCGRRG